MLLHPLALRCLGIALMLSTCWLKASADETTAVADEPKSLVDRQKLYEDVMQRGADYLLERGQHEDGSFTKAADPGVSALCLTALLRAGRSPDDPAVEKSLEYLSTFIQPDGGIYRPGSFYQNYETCISMLAFHEANTDGRYRDILDRAAKFVRDLQWDESEGKDASDPAYGGAGYGRHKRPDLSNTQFFIEALKAEENDENREAIQRALIFVSRSQNLESEHNQLPFPKLNPDGGFYYTPVASGESEAGSSESGGLRSYGSMTYAGLKSMIHAGVAADDPRVVAAIQWLKKNYSLAENPGMGDSGLYYYLHTFAKALNALGESEFLSEDGKRHDWRWELLEALAEKQNGDGSWVNANARWMENDPNLVTAYSLLALSYCKPTE